MNLPEWLFKLIDPFVSEIHRLRYWRRRRSEQLEEQIEKARDAGKTDEVRQLRQDKRRRDYEYHCQIQEASSRGILSEASKLRVPTPPITDDDGEETPYWQRSPVTGSRYLTREGMEWTREKIRKEKRWRMERRKHWATVAGGVLSALTGVLGALTGLFAVLAQG